VTAQRKGPGLPHPDPQESGSPATTPVQNSTEGLTPAATVTPVPEAVEVECIACGYFVLRGPKARRWPGTPRATTAGVVPREAVV
jgi:hypothetical protein